MRILLIQSYLGGNEPPVFPIGLACLRAVLGEHTVRLFDPNVTDTPFEQLDRQLREFEPEVVGVSLRNIDSTNKREVVFYYAMFKELIARIRENFPGPLVVGGSGFSMFAERIMRDEPAIDFGVYLEGEESFPRLLEHLNHPEQVRSIYYRRGDQVLFSGPAERQVDVNRHPFPVRSGLDLDRYQAGYRDAIGVETKRGCFLNCIYCIYGFLNGKKIRPRDPVLIVDEIAALVSEHGVRRITFVDSVFNLPPKHAEGICRELLARDLPVKWSAWFHEKYLSQELIELASAAGCDNFILSPDAYADPTLETLSKDLSTREIERGFELMSHTSGVEVSYNFFKNPPGQSLRNFWGMARFCLKAKRALGRRVHFEFNSMRVEPNTRLCEIAIAEGVVGANEDLLFPRYYTNRRTIYIEWLFNLALRLKGK